MSITITEGQLEKMMKDAVDKAIRNYENSRSKTISMAFEPMILKPGNNHQPSGKSTCGDTSCDMHSYCPEGTCPKIHNGTYEPLNRMREKFLREREKERDEEHWRNIDLTDHHRRKQRYFDYLRMHMTASQMQDLKDSDMSGYYDRL